MGSLGGVCSGAVRQIDYVGALGGCLPKICALSRLPTTNVKHKAASRDPEPGRRRHVAASVRPRGSSGGSRMLVEGSGSPAFSLLLANSAGASGAAGAPPQVDLSRPSSGQATPDGNSPAVARMRENPDSGQLNRLSDTTVSPARRKPPSGSLATPEDDFLGIVLHLSHRLNSNEPPGRLDETDSPVGQLSSK
jgi:hypothetical protein